MSDARSKTLIFAEVRGFCRGVVGALAAFQRAGEKGKPVYVLRELVHNSFVTAEMKQRGAIFVKSPDEVPENSILLFGAHGVTPEEEAKARARNLDVVDATCPLVKKLQHAAEALSPCRQLVLHGKAGHPEAVGILAHSRAGANFLIRGVGDIASLPKLPSPVLLTQTTLGYREVAEVRSLLLERFPGLEAPSGVCDASRRRQLAVEKLAATCELVIVIGSPHSSNANELCATAVAAGAAARMVDDPAELRREEFSAVRRIGLTAGASTPDRLISLAAQRLESFGFLAKEG